MENFPVPAAENRAWLLVAVLAGCGTASPPSPTPGLGTTNTEHLGYFGQHFHRIVVNGEPGPTVFPPPRADGSPVVGIARTWDSGVGLWAGIERTQGTYDFTALDLFVEMAHDNGAAVLHTLGPGTPPWASARPDEPFVYGLGGAAEPRDMQPYVDYLTALFTRYRGKIAYYELWNEPSFDHGTGGFYTGTASELWALHETAVGLLRYIDPAAKFLGPSFVGLSSFGEEQGALEVYLDTAGPAYCDDTDILGYHFYSPSPEALVALHHRLLEIVDARCPAPLPTWNTEAGYQTRAGIATDDPRYATTVDPALLPGWLARDYLWGMSLGLGRFAYYSYDGYSGLFSDQASGTLLPLGQAQLQIGAWLEGATLGACMRGGNGVHVCEVTRTANGLAHLVWNSQDLPVPFTAPASWDPPAEIEHLDGSRSASTAQLEVTGEPMLVKSSTRDWHYDAADPVAAPASMPADCPLASTYVSDVTTDAPLAYYRMAQVTNATVADETAHHFDATLSGSGVVPVDGALYTHDDAALSFSSATGTMRLPAAVAPWGGDFSIELWVSSDGFAGSQMALYLGDYLVSGFRFAPTFTLSDDLGRFALWSGESGGTVGLGTETFLRATGWHHFALVHTQATATFSMYLDGLLEATQNAATFVPPAATAQLEVGGGAGRMLRGAIDELAVYDRALDGTRVRSHYQHGSNRCDLPAVER